MLLGVILTLLVIGLVGYSITRVFAISFERFPRGVKIREVPSPSGEWSIWVFYDKGSATIADSIRAEAVHTRTGARWVVYFRNGESAADVAWRDELVVTINGVQLRLISDRYIHLGER